MSRTTPLSAPLASVEATALQQRHGDLDLDLHLRVPGCCETATRALSTLRIPAPQRGIEFEPGNVKRSGWKRAGFDMDSARVVDVLEPDDDDAGVHSLSWDTHTPFAGRVRSPVYEAMLLEFVHSCEWSKMAVSSHFSILGPGRRPRLVHNQRGKKQTRLKPPRPPLLCIRVLSRLAILSGHSILYEACHIVD